MTLRVLIAVTHLLGAGHLTRAAAIGQALVRAGQHVTLATGGAPAPLIDTAGLQVVQLPPVRTALDDFTTLLDVEGRPASPARLEERRRLLVDAFAGFRPDVVVTELFPFGRRGLAAEFTALLEAAEGTSPRPLVICSIRDVLVAPTKPAKVAATHALVAQRYDAVLVHGAEAVLPLDASWPVDAALRERLIYTGYVSAEPASPVLCPGNSGEIVVSGGSSAAGLLLYEAALEAAASTPDRCWRLLFGAAVAEADRRRLEVACPANAVVEPARADFRQVLRGARVFVGQAGYNTVMDIVATRCRAVLVPFERGRETEQRLRADGLASRGYALVVPEAELSPARLRGAVLEAETRPRPPEADFPLDGAAETARRIAELASARASSS